MNNRPATPTLVYTPDAAITNPGMILRDIAGDMWGVRELAWRLAVRDIAAQYRQTAFGLFWMFLSPLFSAFIWMYLNASGIISVKSTDLPYPVYVLVGTLVWSIFTEAVNSPMQQVNASKSILSKVNFPKEALVVSGIIQVALNVTIRIAITAVMIIILGIRPDWKILLFPLAVISLIGAGTVLGLALTPVGVLYTDTTKLTSLFLQLAVYFSPVMFPIPERGIGAIIFRLNPMTPLVMTARDWMTGMSSGYVQPFIWINVVVVVLLVMMLVIYRIAMPILAERMNA